MCSLARLLRHDPSVDDGGTLPSDGTDLRGGKGVGEGRRTFWTHLGTGVKESRVTETPG